MSIVASGDRLLLSERFVSLQGEGVSTGVPSAFLRLGNCNLSCVYCDTPYTWDEQRFDLASELVPFEVGDLAEWISVEAPGRLILTGGEPLLQHKLLTSLLEQADERIAKLGRARLFVEVETNGTLFPNEELFARVDQWNISPKLEISQEDERRRFKPQVLSRFAVDERCFFKFVVRGPACVKEVEAWIKRLELPRTRVLLMPEATAVEQLRKRGPEVAAWAVEAGLRYSGRLHLELYGGKRGT